MRRISAVRMVRGLDAHPGETKDVVKTVAGIPIEKDVPLPSGRGHGAPWLQALLALEPGESFLSTSKSCVWSKKAKATGRVFSVLTLARGKYRIFRRA